MKLWLTVAAAGALAATSGCSEDDGARPSRGAKLPDRPARAVDTPDSPGREAAAGSGAEAREPHAEGNGPAGPAVGEDGPASPPGGEDGEDHGDGGDAYVPAPEFHLDDVVPARRPRRVAKPAASESGADERQIVLTLRSSPSNAVVSIDGVAIGRTPTVWEGPAAHKSREFTFVLPGYAMARYRFVPITSGVVHGTLTKLAAEPAEPAAEVDVDDPAGAGGAASPPAGAPPTR
jgi:hypothetical protein